MLSKLLRELNKWRGGIRIYIAVATVLVTLEVWWWSAVSYSGSILFSTRIEETYAWLSLGLITSAIMIGPIYSIFKNLPGRKITADARRLLGISGAWFGVLHASIAYIALFKTANPFDLPRNYQQAFALGLFGLIILFLMAITSFDAAFKKMGIWWFRLHRFVYAALIVILLHAFMIGVHSTSWISLSILTTAATALLAMHVYLGFIRKHTPSIWQIVTLSFSIVLLVAVFNYGYGQKLGYNPIEGKHIHKTI